MLSVQDAEFQSRKEKAVNSLDSVKVQTCMQGILVWLGEVGGGGGGGGGWGRSVELDSVMEEC